MENAVYIGSRFKDADGCFFVQVWEAKTGEQIGEYRDGDPKIPDGCIIYNNKSFFVDAMDRWHQEYIRQLNRRCV